MPKELYSRFPTGTSEEDIYNMFLTGTCKATCCNCSLVNTIELDPSLDTFRCRKCLIEQVLPMLNPKEMEERTSDLEDINIDIS